MAKILVSFGDSWPWGSELDFLASPNLMANLDPESKNRLSQVINSHQLLTVQDHINLAEKIRCTFSYPYLVANQLRCSEVIDLSGFGTSLNHLFLELCKFKTILTNNPDDQYIFLVSLTSIYRDLYFEQATGKPCEIMPYADTAWYYRHIDTEHTGVVNWVRIVSLFQLFCKQHQIPDFYFQEFTDLTSFQLRLEDYQSMIDWSRVYQQGLRSFMTYFYQCVGVDHRSVPNYSKFDSKEISKYFHPCVNHPNIAGHQAISECVLDFIQTLNPELFST